MQAPISPQSAKSRAKEKMGFWCPHDLEEGVQALINAGAYQDKSKAIVALLRKGLQKEHVIAPPLQQRVMELAQFLDRDPDAVIGECVRAIVEMMDNDSAGTPLIMKEVALRRTRGFRVGLLENVAPVEFE